MLNLEAGNQEGVGGRGWKARVSALESLHGWGRRHGVQSERDVKDTRGQAYPGHISHFSIDGH